MMLSLEDLGTVLKHPDAGTRRSMLLYHLFSSMAFSCRVMSRDPGMSQPLGEDRLAVSEDLDELAGQYGSDVRPDPKGAWT